MKHLLYFILALLPFLGISQEKATTIKVSARAIHMDPSPTYKAIVSLSTAFSSYAADGMGLEELQSHYKKALESSGISWSELKETPYEFGFETMGYDKEGAVYEYTTTSTEKMRAFLGIKSLGLQRLNAIAILEIDSKESKKLYDDALNDARTKAAAIAQTLGRELGEVMVVEDNQYVGKQVETSIFYDRPVGEYIYSLLVTFSTQ
ncbi:SIMPL domain-containing protein [Flagellimonas aequoris]|uniref:DUF541 domain-containing protein n=1 Tax=Flagellimonas aequoris TaxID=2306997 RepID=A0A418NAR0_9FLAO|nr:SIMPL domain-containing protein [Allomuricauda aequoris]RIV72850.1 DUF541 domain-containing protein [Allomuricauda aequoris]TXK05356.1 DUF541 domain-containing protein [Allomuricauda aequoris]